MTVRIGEQAPYFEFLDGIKGKSLYDLKQKYHIVIYKAKDDQLEDKEEEFERANIKLIDYVQLLTEDFCEQFGCDPDGDFIVIIDKYGTVQYVSSSVPSFQDIMSIISFSEDEGCCSL
ncbi:MAG TPA: hypothetical protein DEP48_04880 [Persephonella sp.]|uniref:Uncharacterized protein n=1 Tax=Persephonella marina (strain DSM 14350 / EX-H1) TaxID=123214 RepID=C0QPW7_PERMH|nr:MULTISPECIES: hypothetical protein [Persephonella]ACO04701.1 hypothetical protein PERMA_0926 [Persephonella marina EX-H1]HCB69672.1 hypothetical protein [Persephonella sp.]